MSDFDFGDAVKRTIAEQHDRIAALEAQNAKLREEFDKMDVWHSKELSAAMAENARLREQLAKARDPQRIGGTADPESFVYAIEQLREFRWQHATNDEEAIPYINNVADAHERENAKLRELVKYAYECAVHSDHATCDDCERINGCCILVGRMRELGVEVDG